MNTAPTTTTVKRRLRRKLAAMGEEQPFIIGSLTKIHRRCGNPNCRCAGENGQKHPAHLLTTKIKGKTHAIYVPVDMVDEVREWCRHYRTVKAQIKGVSDCCEQLIGIHAWGCGRPILVTIIVLIVVELHPRLDRCHDPRRPNRQEDMRPLHRKI